MQVAIPGPTSRRWGEVPHRRPAWDGRLDALGQRRRHLPSSAWTRRREVKQGKSGGSVGTTDQGKGKGRSVVRPMGTVAYRGKGQGKAKGRGEGRLGQGGRGRSKGGEKLMGTTAYGGKGSKGRAANGDRPVGAASCRRDHHTMALCQIPPPPPLNRKDRAVQFHDTLQLATSSTFASKRFVPFFFCSRLVSSIALNQLKLPQLNVAATPHFHISVSLYLPQLNVAATPHFHISVSLYLLMLPLPFRKVGEFCKRTRD